MTTAPVTPASFWQNCIALFTTVNVALGTATTIVSSVDDLALALKAQTEIIKETSENDAIIKRLDLQDRITARKQARLPLPTTETEEASDK